MGITRRGAMRSEAELTVCPLARLWIACGLTWCRCRCRCNRHGGCRWRRIAARQAVYKRRDLMNLILGQLRRLGRHDIGLAVFDDVDNGGFAPAVQPIVVR